MRIVYYALLGMVCLGACKNSDGDLVRTATTIQVIHAACFTYWNRLQLG